MWGLLVRWAIRIAVNLLFFWVSWILRTFNFVSAVLSASMRRSGFRLRRICDQDSNFVSNDSEPDHLLVLVHGIMSSPSDWAYAEADLKRRLGSNFFIYASSSNSYTKTFDGIDEAGKRLAEEVLCAVKKTISLKRISFLAHSLGGLFARYAIAILYASNTQEKDMHEKSTNGKGNEPRVPCKSGTIAGLEPVNFITLASPHLGVRGKRQLPFLFGVPVLEKLVLSLAPILVGQAGHQLFLTDGDPRIPPLLLRMASDSDLKFLSALAAFKRRAIYANVSYDHMVGWRTSSIRRETEVLKSSRSSLDGYKHVMDVEYCPPTVSEDGPHYYSEAAKGKEAAQTAPNTQDTAEYYDLMEEEMISGLERIGWLKVDISFHSAFWPFFAHNSIHVKNEWLYNAGAGVIAHVADNIKQQESCQNLLQI